MTSPRFGRITPLQMDMLGLAGELTRHGWDDPSLDADRIVAMRQGLADLRKRTGVDFGYDLGAWHAFLLKNSDLSEEYTFTYAWKCVKKRIEQLLTDPDRLRLVELCNADEQ